MVLLLDHTHDLDLEVSRSKFEIALFQEWEGWLTLNRRDVICNQHDKVKTAHLTIHGHGRDLWFVMVGGWIDDKNLD